MNKNGFTLTELIAVIVILGLLALIANSSVVNVVKNSKSDLYNTQLKLIEAAAESWGSDNFDKLPNDGECKYLTLADLKNYGLMEEKIINPKNNREFSDDLTIKITSKINSSGVLKTTYKVDDNISECKEALPPVCTLALDSEKKGFEKGAKYNCKVKDVMELGFENGYTFYVLGKNEDGTINLIMDQNINSDGTTVGNISTPNEGDNVYNLVAWNSSNLTSNGPVDAMQFLYNATKNWDNIPPINYVYKDIEFTGVTNGYVSFITIDGIATIVQLSGSQISIGTKENPLKVRMPIYTQKNSMEYGEVAHRKADLSNAFLYENLDTQVGYWTLSSCDGNTSYHVRNDGYVGYNNVDMDRAFGVRPVITLYDYQIR